MVRVYTAWKNSYTKFFPNKVMSYLVEGIQLNGGKIISFKMVPIATSTSIIERILIVYEDNDHYDEIMEFLNGKEDFITSWIKSIK